MMLVMAQHRHVDIVDPLLCLCIFWYRSFDEERLRQGLASRHRLNRVPDGAHITGVVVLCKVKGKEADLLIIVGINLEYVLRDVVYPCLCLVRGEDHRQLGINPSGFRTCFLFTVIINPIGEDHDKEHDQEDGYQVGECMVNIECIQDFFGLCPCRYAF